MSSKEIKFFDIIFFAYVGGAVGVFLWEFEDNWVDKFCVYLWYCVYGTCHIRNINVMDKNKVFIWRIEL